MNSMVTGANADALLCTHDALSNASTTFGFEAGYGKITDVSYNEANAMMLDVSTKFVASGTTALFAIHY